MKVFDSNTSRWLEFEVGLFEGPYDGTRRIKVFKMPLVFGSTGIDGGCLYANDPDDPEDDHFGYSADTDAVEFFGLEDGFANKVFDSHIEALSAILKESPRFTLA